jgi:serine protease Do
LSIDHTKRRRAAALVVVFAIFVAEGSARAAQSLALPPWFVQVNHRIDLDKYIDLARNDMPDVDISTQTVRRVTNLTAGILVDADGHVVSRLVNYDPRVTDLELSVTANDGRKLPATLVGLDAPTGFVVLHVPGLRGTPAAPVSKLQGLAATDAVRILRRDYAHTPQRAVVGGRSTQKRPSILPTLPPLRGVVESPTVSAFLARTGAVSTLKSAAFVSSGDLSLVESLGGQLLGVARYDMRGRGQLITIAFLRDVVAARVLAARGSVECGWLGADGSAVSEAPSSSVPAADAKGVLVSRVIDNGPAVRAGLRVDDLIIEFDCVPVSSLAEFGALVRGTPAGTTVPLTVLRRGNPTTVFAMLGKRPPSGTTRLAPTSPDFGLSVLELNPQLAEFLGVSNGVFVEFVRSGTPAGTAGLRAGDVIVMVGDTPVRNRAGFNAAIVAAPTSTVPFSVHRERKVIRLTVSLDAPK